MKKNIAFIFGGRSCEHDISIITGLHAYNALRSKVYNKLIIYVRDGKMYTGNKLADLDTYVSFSDKSLTEIMIKNGYLYKLVKNKLKGEIKIDCAVMCMHGGEGENGAFQGFLEINGIPYTSSGVFASSAFMDKEFTKNLLRSENLPYVEYVVLKTNSVENVTEATKKLGFPLIVKPARLGSSIGIVKAKSRDELDAALKVAFMYDDKVIVERCIEGFAELNCAAVRLNGETTVSVIERPVTSHDFLSYDDKYIGGRKLSSDREIPAKLSKALTNTVREMTKTVYEAFDFSGVVRIDYILDGEALYINEINTIPGSLAYYLFSRQGISYSELIEKMVEDALIRFSKDSRLTKTFESSVLQNYVSQKDNNKYIKK